MPVGVIEDLVGASDHLVAVEDGARSLLERTAAPGLQIRKVEMIWRKKPADDVEVPVATAAPVVEAPVVIAPHGLHDLVNVDKSLFNCTSFHIKFLSQSSSLTTGYKPLPSPH